MPELIVNFDQPREKQMLLAKVRDLRGQWRVSFVHHRPRRSDRQNRYYWPCFVQPFGDYLRGQGHKFTDEMAHAVLKEMFLQTTIIDHEAGRTLTYTRSTTELNTLEFNNYLDEVAAFLATDCGIVVPEPDVYRERAA